MTAPPTTRADTCGATYPHGGHTCQRDPHPPTQGHVARNDGELVFWHDDYVMPPVGWTA